MTIDEIEPRLVHLLQATIERQTAADVAIQRVKCFSIRSGLSGARVRRYRVTVREATGVLTERWLVVKDASRKERHAVMHLNAQRQPSVPFGHTFDLETDVPAMLCLRDVGDTCRPTSLEPITSDLLWREARGLAAIHAANLAHAESLTWLPCADRAYFVANLEERFWRPAWERALADRAFVRRFGSYRGPVEAAAAQSAQEMADLCRDDTFATLVHGDINPGNVLVQGGEPFFIDWQAAHYGTLFLDIPHHFCTRAQAEQYRLALAERGRAIPPRLFDEGYRAASRYIGLRYLWWTLDAWRTDPGEEPWVLHYLHMITDAR